MVKYFFREKNDSRHAAGSRGSIRQAILVVLLLITAGLGYLYFFTGLIRPREHIAIAPPPAAPPVKQPLPPRLTQEAIEQASTAAKEDEKGAAAGTEGKTATLPPPVTTPAAHPATKPAAVPGAMTAASPAPKPAPSQIQPQSGMSVKTKEKPAVKAEAKTRTVSPLPTTKPAKRSETKTKQVVTEGNYTLQIGGLASSKEAEKIRTRLLKQGITNISVRKVKKTETMHRVFLGEFESQATANAEFSQLKTVAAGAFVLRENGRYLLYAGSFLHENRAKEELKRLVAKGLKPGLRSAKVSITVNEVLAGSFSGSGDAQKEAERLKKLGIVSRVIKTGE